MHRRNFERGHEPVIQTPGLMGMDMTWLFNEGAIYFGRGQ